MIQSILFSYWLSNGCVVIVLALDFANSSLFLGSCTQRTVVMCTTHTNKYNTEEKAKYREIWTTFLKLPSRLCLKMSITKEFDYQVGAKFAESVIIHTSRSSRHTHTTHHPPYVSSSFSSAIITTAVSMSVVSDSSSSLMVKKFVVIITTSTTCSSS